MLIGCRKLHVEQQQAIVRFARAWREESLRNKVFDDIQQYLHTDMGIANDAPDLSNALKGQLSMRYFVDSCDCHWQSKL
jgi:hypothetical protein